MAITQEQKVVLQAQNDGVICRERFDQRQHGFDRLIERRVRPSMDTGSLDEHIQLRDQLDAKHRQLLIQDIACFGTFGDLVGQRFFVSEDQMGIVFRSRGRSGYGGLVTQGWCSSGVRCKGCSCPLLSSGC